MQECVASHIQESCPAPTKDFTPARVIQIVEIDSTLSIRLRVPQKGERSSGAHLVIAGEDRANSPKRHWQHLKKGTLELISTLSLKLYEMESQLLFA